MKDIKEYAGQMAEVIELLAEARTEEERIELRSDLAKLHTEASRSYTEAEIQSGIYEAREEVTA